MTSTTTQPVPTQRMPPPGDTDRRTRVTDAISSAALFVLCALLFFVAPLTAPFGDVFVGTANFPYDAPLNAGILEWGFRSLWTSERDFFEWTAGYPLHNSLAGTENLLGWQLFYSPLRASGIGVVAGYNCLMIGSFVASAVGARLLARRLGAEEWGARVAGVVFAFAPFHLTHAMHLQTMAVCWSPFAVYFLDRFLERPQWRDGIALVAAFTLSLFSAMYVGVFLAAVLVAYGALSWVLGRAAFSWRTAGGLICAGAAATMVSVPLLRHYIRFNSEHGFHHPVEILTRFSLELIALVKVPAWVAVWSQTWLARDARETAAFPGIVVLVLVGAFIARRSHRSAQEERVGLLLAILVAVAVAFALGPVLKLRGDYPSRIAQWVPLPGRIFTVVSAIRWPVRTMLYAYLFGSVLAGLGLSDLLRRFTRSRRWLAGSLVLAVLILEYHPSSTYARRSFPMGAPLALSGAYRVLASEADRGAVAELPLADSTGYKTPMRTRYTYASAGHLRRVLAFHGSVRVAAIDSLEAIAARLPDARALQLLTRQGVTRLVVHRQLMAAAEGQRLIRALRDSAYPVLYEGQDAVLVALPSTSHR